MKLVAISHAFSGVPALAEVDWEPSPGEIHGLVGSNGAGKSTLLRVLVGEITPDRGRVERQGERVAFVHQHPAILPELDVAENLALGRDGFWISWPRRRRRAEALLQQVGARIDPCRRGASLSLPEQQLVEIARALRDDPDLLVLDEPTAALPQADAERLFAVVRGLAAAGRCVIWVSHRLEEVLALCSRITVLRDGRKVGTFGRADLDATRLVGLMAGDLGERAAAAEFVPRAGQVVPRLALSGRVELSVWAGEIVTLFGLVGSGRTELLRAIYGIDPDPGLQVHVDGQIVQSGDPRLALGCGIALVPEDRRRDGVVVDASVLANATLPVLRTQGRLTREGAARARLEELQLRCADENLPVASLSGGNQQKVALARMLVTDPKVLLLDEPTQGVDVAAKAELERSLRGLAASGVAVLAVCSELDEALRLGDRVGVMRKGRLVAMLRRRDASQESVLAHAFGSTSGGPAA